MTDVNRDKKNQHKYFLCVNKLNRCNHPSKFYPREMKSNYCVHSRIGRPEIPKEKQVECEFIIIASFALFNRRK